MSVLKKITPVIVGSFALFGFANAAMVTVGGHDVYEENFANGVVETSGSTELFDVAGPGVTTGNEAIGGSVRDGVRCATSGCSFEVHFAGGVENQAGNDIALFGVGVGPAGLEDFDIKINGVLVSGLALVGTGISFDTIYEISYLEIDLDAFGVLANGVISKIEIIVNTGMNSEEFALAASLNDVAVPLPAAVWLFGSVLAAGGFAGRRKRALKAAKA